MSSRENPKVIWVVVLLQHVRRETPNLSSGPSANGSLSRSLEPRPWEPLYWIDSNPMSAAVFSRRIHAASVERVDSLLPMLEIGPIDLSTYRFLYAVGILTAGGLSLHRLVKGGIPEREALRIWIFTIWGGLAGSWLLHQAVVQFHTLSAFGTVAPTVRGTTVIGGMLGGTLVALILCRRWALPVGRVFDLAILPVPLGLAIGRLGCLAAGCCYGRTTDSRFGLYLPDATGTWADRYPTQYLSGAVDFLIFLSLVAIERRSGLDGADRKGPFSGFLTLVFVIAFCGKRILIETLRVTRPPVLGSLSWAQLLAAVCLVIAVGLMAAHRLRID